MNAFKVLDVLDTKLIRRYLEAREYLEQAQQAVKEAKQSQEIANQAFEDGIKQLDRLRDQVYKAIKEANPE